MENKIKVDLILDIAHKNEFLPYLIEKDYYLTLFLQKLSDENISNLIFKGGTCLNKCYLGFYRLSEDLDFIYNKDFRNVSITQLKLLLDELRTKLKKIILEVGFKYSGKFGQDWNMIKINGKVSGLVLFANYNSQITKKEEQIKIEISFRNKLVQPISKQIINHEFIDVLGVEILPKNKVMNCISLVENFAEKYRALFTRPIIAVRDLYDIYYILINKSIKIDTEFKNLVLLKLNETKNLTISDLDQLINNLKSISSKINNNELEIVLKQGLVYNLDEIINKIVTTWFEDYKNIKKTI